MRIILVNYRYFISGGPERYYFNIKELLEKNGHVVIPFSVKSSRNLPIMVQGKERPELEKYFLDIVDDEVYFAQSAKKKKSLRLILKSFSRMFYSLEAKQKMKLLIKDEKPDLVYIIQMHNKISPSIVEAAREMKVPVVHRISDFQYMCPNALFYNDRIGVCEECLRGNRMACVRNKCVLNSAVYSGIKMMAKWMHDIMKVHKRIDAFVVPSEFTCVKLHEYGIPNEKLNHIPTFFNLKEVNPEVSNEPFVLYVGRLEKQKGLITLLKAFKGLDYHLKLIGFSSDGYEDELKAFAGDSKNIEFLGRMDFEQIAPYLKSCLCTVVPSEWYDNFPNSLIESYAFKKAVIATDFGSLQYMVKEGQTGLKFKYADTNDLKFKVQYVFEHQEEAKQMGNNGYQLVETVYSPDAHYKKLMEVFSKVQR